MKVIVTESQLKKIVSEQLVEQQSIINPNLLYAHLMRALSLGNIEVKDAVFYLDNMAKQLEQGPQDGQRATLVQRIGQLRNWLLNKGQEQTNNQMQQDQQETQQVKPATSVSDEAFSDICQRETMHKFGYKMGPKDLNGYYNPGEGKKTYGYGLKTHPNGKFMEDIKQTWTQPELEQLFKQKIGNETQWVLNWANKNGIQLGQGQLDAMVSAVYNYGRNGFLKTGIPGMIAQNPENPKIPEVWATASDHRKNMGGLHARRRKEAEWYQKDIPQQNA